MMKKLLTVFAVLILSALPRTLMAEEFTARFDEKTSLKEDTVFSGTVYIKDNISVPKGVTLTIEPGTVIKFGFPGICDDGNVNFSIEVNGSILAIGSEDKPIIFTSTSDKKPSAFGEIFINESPGSRFEHVRFTYSHWALHVHDSNVTVQNCELKDCFGGVRFKGDKITLLENSFIDNDTSLRFWMAAPEIRGNKFKNVGTAIFIREKVKEPVITGNRFEGIRDYFVKLGELQEDDITVTGNDFGTEDNAEISEKMFDKKDEDYIGEVNIIDVDE